MYASDRRAGKEGSGDETIGKGYPKHDVCDRMKSLIWTRSDGYNRYNRYSFGR